MHPNRCNFFNPIFSKFIYFEISLKFELVSEMTSAFLWLLQPKINRKWSKKGKQLPLYWQESDDKQKTKLEFKSKSKVRVTAWKVWLHIYKHKWTSFANSQAGGMGTWSWTALKSIFRETLFVDQLLDFLILSLISFLHEFLKSKSMKKFLATLKSFIFEGWFS